jgi:hypothetical protein
VRSTSASLLPRRYPKTSSRLSQAWRRVANHAVNGARPYSDLCQSPPEQLCTARAVFRGGAMCKHLQSRQTAWVGTRTPIVHCQQLGMRVRDRAALSSLRHACSGGACCPAAGLTCLESIEPTWPCSRRRDITRSFEPIQVRRTRELATPDARSAPQTITARHREMSIWQSRARALCRVRMQCSSSYYSTADGRRGLAISCERLDGS